MIHGESFRTRRATLAFATALLLAALPAQAGVNASAHLTKEKALVVEHADIVLQAQGADTAAAYLTLWNGTPKTVRLVALEGDGLGSVSLRRTETIGGVPRVRLANGGLEVPSNTELLMKPDGVHATLASLSPDLFKEGSTALTLVFADGTRVATRAELLASSARVRDHHHGQGDVQGK